MALTRKQEAFVEAYLKTWNATQAAIQAGYSERSAASIGSENLRKPEIDAAIRARLDELKMSADEVLVLIADVARNSSLEHFVRVTDDKIVADFSRANGKLHYLKEIEFVERSYGDIVERSTKYKLHDRVQAATLIGKHHKLFTDRVEIADWRRELEAAGLDPDAQLNELTQQIETHLRRGTEGDDAGSGGEGAGTT